jgi:hypothetical protein
MALSSHVVNPTIHFEDGILPDEIGHTTLKGVKKGLARHLV